MGVLIRRVLLVVNPASRRGGRLLEAVTQAFRARGVACEVARTTRPGEGARVAAARGAGFDAVFTLGGDGTAMEVVDALAGSGVPVGILPGGTGNLIARTLGIPLVVRHAVGVLLDATPVDVDLGRLGTGHRFAFAAGVGIDSAMIEGTPPTLKRRFGVLAYVLSAARAVLAGRRFVARVTVDGTTHERRAVAVMVANFGVVLNELITLGPGIVEDDGVLDVCVFSPRGLLDSVRVLWRLWRRDFRDDPSLLYLPGRSITIATDPPRVAQADGELIGPTPFTVEVEARAARMLRPGKGRR